jgi:UDP-3-O-[3-hydroxymyristoyl] N-acetylglucosamine deacetylase
MDKIVNTISREITVTGTGLHTGDEVTTVLRPREDPGVFFVREDLPDKPVIRANICNHVYKLRRTVLSSNGAEVHTPEHLLATLFALGIGCVEIGVWGSEIPGLDGSARIWAEEILSTGTVPLDTQKKPVLKLNSAFCAIAGKSALAVVPHSSVLNVTYHLDHDTPFIPVQDVSFFFSREAFLDEIASARTFVLETEVKQLRQAGLGRGATVKNTLVVGENGVQDNTLRFEDEFARHKLLDFIGDFALLEASLSAHFACLRSGHELNTAIVKKIRENAEKEE